MKKVFVSYFVTKVSATGSAKFLNRTILELENSILSEEDLDEIEKQLKKLYSNNNENYVNVTIINWKELSA